MIAYDSLKILKSVNGTLANCYDEIVIILPEKTL